MPVCDEVAFIERSVGSVLAQDYDRQRMEILVVDGMSTDGTREIVDQTIEREKPSQGKNGASPSLTLLDNPSRIVPPALNIGLRHARGEIIIRVDGHCEVPPDYVRRCVETLNRVDADCVGGKIITIGKTRTAKAIALAQSSRFGVGAASFRSGIDSPRYVDTLAFGAYRREVFQRIGAFDEELVRNQDDEFNFRLIHRGGKIWLDPSILSIYYSRASLRRLWTQYFQYGLWKVRVMQKHTRQMSLRHFVPPTAVAGLFLGALLGVLSPPIFYLWLALLSLYALASIGASIGASCRGGWAYVGLLPVAFITLHLSYGVGFLVGLVRFWNRWLCRV